MVAGCFWKASRYIVIQSVQAAMASLEPLSHVVVHTSAKSYEYWLVRFPVCFKKTLMII